MKPRAFKRIWGKPWDFAYLLELEYHKIKEMRDHHKKHQSWEGCEIAIRDMTTCLNLIDIILEKDKRRYDVYTNNNRTHINIRNAKRFANYFEGKVFEKSEVSAVIKNMLRIEKALYLYNKIRAYKMLTWWD